MTLNAAENNDSEPSKVQKTNVGDAVNTNIVEVLGEGDGRYYSVITSTGFVKDIILDTPLRSNDQYTKKNKVPTDTDKDGIYDWDEVNTEFILNLDKNANISDRDYIITSQLPTIEEMINEYDWRFYVKNVYRKVYSYKAPHLKEKPIYILPIYSSPVDADSDSDGILDIDDESKLKQNSKLDEKSKFCDVKSYSDHIFAKVKKQAYLYATPFEKSHIYGKIEINDIIEICYIVQSNDEYWYKVKTSNYNSWGYVKFDIIDTPQRIINEWKDILLLSPIEMPYSINAYCESLDLNIENFAAQGVFALEEEQLYLIKASCNKVRNLYSNYTDSYNNGIKINPDTKKVLDKYLTPELIIAICGTESSFFSDLSQGGVGLTQGGVERIKDMLGGENLSSVVSDYKDKINPSIYAGVVIFANNVNYVLNVDEFVNNYELDGSINYGQAIYNAFYTYGAGTNINNYYGYRKNGESPMSSAYKMFIYYNLCSITGTDCAVEVYNDISTTISDYTNLGEENIWNFQFLKKQL